MPQPPAAPVRSALIDDIRHIIDTARQQAYGAINAAMITAYWNTGRRIVEEEQRGDTRAAYGDNLLAKLATALTQEYGKGFSEQSLRKYRQFYLYFKDLQIRSTRGANLTWSHYRRLLSVQSEAARLWYLNEAEAQTWSVRTLDRNINTQYYERMLISPHKDIVEREMHRNTTALQHDRREFIRNPVVTEFLGLSQQTDFTETVLESAIISHMQQFLLELGKGYAFIGRQQHIRTEENDYFIDLVFYNVYLKCYVLIDLKTDKISYQDVGQMEMYLQLYDTHKKQDDDNPTLGIILCSETDMDVARFSTLAKNPQLFAAKYKLYLPTEQELRQEIERQKLIYHAAHPAAQHPQQ